MESIAINQSSPLLLPILNNNSTSVTVMFSTISPIMSTKLVYHEFILTLDKLSRGKKGT